MKLLDNLPKGQDGYLPIAKEMNLGASPQTPGV